MQLLQKFLKRTEFDSYEDFKANFELNIPENFNFAEDVVDFWAENEPEKRALLYCDDNGTEKTFTFREISELSKKCAGYLQHIGVKKGDRILTLLRRRYEYWITAVAIHRIGATLVPASIQLTTKDIVYRVNEAGIKYIVAIDDAFVLSQLYNAEGQMPGLKNILLVTDEEESFGYLNYHKGLEADYPLKKCEPLHNSDEMLIYFTSGTAGMPKMVVHERTYPLGHIVTAKYMQRVQNNGLHLTFADSGWAKFGWGNLYGQWICGSAVLGYDPRRFNAVNMLETIQRTKPTSFCVPPTMYRFLLRDGLKKEHVQSIKWFSTAGEALDPQVNMHFRKITGHAIHEAFGQSEGTPITCSFEFFPPKPGSMGKPSPLYDVCILDESGNIANPGEKGEVVIRLPKEGIPIGLMRGYYRDGLLEEHRDEYYRTGDIAYEDRDGYFWYVGRNDDMIKCSGYRIGPFEIESVLNTHPAVKESAIIAREDSIRGQVVCAVLVLSDGYTPSEELTKQLQDYVKTNTAPYKYPRIVEYVTDLPKTTSGKIIRSTLRKWTL